MQVKISHWEGEIKKGVVGEQAEVTIVDSLWRYFSLKTKSEEYWDADSRYK